MACGRASARKRAPCQTAGRTLIRRFDEARRDAGVCLGKGEKKVRAKPCGDVVERVDCHDGAPLCRKRLRSGNVVVFGEELADVRQDGARKIRWRDAAGCARKERLRKLFFELPERAAHALARNVELVRGSLDAAFAVDGEKIGELLLVHTNFVPFVSLLIFCCDSLAVSE